MAGVGIPSSGSTYLDCTLQVARKTIRSLNRSGTCGLPPAVDDRRTSDSGPKHLPVPWLGSSPRRNGRRELAARTLSKHGTSRWREDYPPSVTGTCGRHNGLRRRTMWLGITSSAALLLFTVSAFADSCIFSAAPPFQLRSDAVDWTMQIASGTSCTRGLKLGPITISDVKLIASPPSGQVVIKGPAFSYTAKPDFQGQDDFTLQVSGTMVRIPGVSDIKVTVSVVAK
jgi:hypothetical protein